MEPPPFAVSAAGRQRASDKSRTIMQRHARSCSVTARFLTSVCDFNEMRVYLRGVNTSSFLYEFIPNISSMLKPPPKLHQAQAWHHSRSFHD